MNIEAIEMLKQIKWKNSCNGKIIEKVKQLKW